MHTTHDPTDVPAWPVYALTMSQDGRVAVSGLSVPTSWHPTRAAAVGEVAGAAARLGRAVRARATEQDGTVWHLAIFPDGEVGELPGPAPGPKAGKKRHDKRPANASATTDSPAVPVAPALPRPGPPPAGAAAPARRQPEPEAGPATYTEILASVREHVEAGRTGPAAELAARLDERAAQDFGVSHPDALRIREVRAQFTALAGDTVAGVELYRDIAERWHYQKADEQAEEAAVRAETLWLEMTDLEMALATGGSVIRMRNQIPGEEGRALIAALERLAWLRETCGARRAQVGYVPAVDAGTPMAG
ncbi:hypothetical protein [Streptomyces sp. NPDC059850]|uniref:hypothetical protein n=1 Tax=Streptomyces sp. NPDC059850 TaxID=3346970 RepID=UPI0036676A76